MPQISEALKLYGLIVVLLIAVPLPSPLREGHGTSRWVS